MIVVVLLVCLVVVDAVDVVVLLSGKNAACCCCLHADGACFAPGHPQSESSMEKRNEKIGHFSCSIVLCV